MSMSSSIVSLDPLSRSSPKLEEEGWEEVEVGKGLAQYNSVEIDRIKGMKRSVCHMLIVTNDRQAHFGL
jgi:glutamate 5-kinase